MNDPSTHMNDAELASFIVDLQLTSPNIGQSLVIGRLRSLGYQVSRAGADLGGFVGLQPPKTSRIKKLFLIFKGEGAL